MMDFSQSPLLVIWEVTQACDLACVHCRASARPWRNPEEVTTEDGYRFLMELRHAQKIGLETQFQTTVTKRNMHQLAEIAEIVREVGSKMWSLFFLIVTGRANAADDLTAEEYEQVFGVMYDLSKTMPFDIKTTEAMHYRRYILQRQKAERGQGLES